MSTHRKTLTRRRVLGASAIGVAATFGYKDDDKGAGLYEILHTGWVGGSGRGKVAGVGLKNMDAAYPYTVGFTTGSYRGNNHSFAFNVPSSAWKTDPHQYNVLKLTIVSGSGGTACLSAGTSFDCIDLLT